MGNSAFERWIVWLFFLGISLGFWMDGQEATVNHLSSDQWNILPVAMKLDNPALFKQDLFADRIENVKYYTPFFVQPLLWFAHLANGDFLQGLNFFHLMVSLLYSILWLTLFQKITGNLWLSAVMTLLCRGIIWPPGNELWGIAGLWTLLPRTVYSAVIPVALLLLFQSLETRKTNLFYAAALAAGFLGNFHPISGLFLGACLIGSFWLYELFFEKTALAAVFKRAIISFPLFLIGLSPYIMLYLQQVIQVKPSNPELFSALLPMRIGNQFLHPFEIFVYLTQAKWLVFFVFPAILPVLLVKQMEPGEKRILAYAYLLFGMILALSTLVIPLEKAVNAASGMQLKMGFQLIRNIKYLIIPNFIFLGLILVVVARKIGSLSLPLVRFFPIILFLGWISLAWISRASGFQAPLLGDDLLRSVFPDRATIKPYGQYDAVDLDLAIAWIKHHTLPEAAFIAPAPVRAGAARSVVHEDKGASMLIEGNPDKFVLWAKRKIAEGKADGPEEKIRLYREWNADYLLSQERFPSLIPLQQFGRYYLYQIQ